MFRVNNASVFLIPLAIFVNAISFEHFSGIEDRLIFKTLSVCILLFIFFLKHKSLKIRRNDFKYFLIPLFFFCLFFSDLINNGISSLNAFIRFIATTIFLIIIINLSKKELFSVLYNCLSLFMILALLGIAFVFLNLSVGEKIPFINIYSTKSIFFEQNIFGICMFFLFISIGIFKKPGPVTYGMPVLGIFLSYYRTVYLLMIIRSILSRYFILIFLILLIFVFYFSAELSLIIKIEQLSTLTGRDILWRIGLEGFSESPIFGLGESAIPLYSNEILNRDPAYTTFHNVFVDILFSGGLVALLVYLLIILYFLSKANKVFWFMFLFFLLAPSMLNTYYIFSFNILGGFVGLVLLYMERIESKYL